MGWIKEDFNFTDMQRLLTKLADQVKVFQGLTPSELTELLSHAEKCSFDPESIIVKEGNVGTYMYVIIYGEAVVTKRGHDSDVELARLTAADSFGEMALIDQEVRSATVRALSPCILVRINDGSLARKPDIAMKFYRNMAKVLSERLRQANELLAWRL
jgi:CRP-like cAMP-binding protein